MLKDKTIAKTINRKLTEMILVSKIAIDDSRHGCNEDTELLIQAIQKLENLYKNLLELKTKSKGE